MFRAIADGFGYLFGLLKELSNYLLDGIWFLLQPLFELIGAIFYLLYMLGLLLVKILGVVLSIAKLLVGVVTGLFKTILGLAYTGSGVSNMPGSYTAAFNKIMPFINSLQLDKVAYILVFGIWITAAFYSIKIIGEMRGSGGSD